MTIEQNAVDALRAFLAECMLSKDPQRAKLRPCFYGMVYKDEKDNIKNSFHPDRPCHQAMTPVTANSLAMGTSAIVIKRNEAVAERFNEWFFSTRSPWRELLQYGVEFIPSKQYGKLGSFILGPDLCKEIGRTIDWYAIKNMFITARAPYEKTENVETWVDLLDEGIPPEEAFLACGLFSKKGELYVYTPVNTSGSHWGITLSDTNLSNFKTGNCNQFASPYATIPPNSGRVNCIFKRAGENNCSSLVTIATEKIKTIAGTTMYNYNPVEKKVVVDIVKTWMKGL